MLDREQLLPLRSHADPELQHEYPKLAAAYVRLLEALFVCSTGSALAVARQRVQELQSFLATGVSLPRDASAALAALTLK